MHVIWRFCEQRFPESVHVRGVCHAPNVHIHVPIVGFTAHTVHHLVGITTNTTLRSVVNIGVNLSKFVENEETGL